jgi:Alpha/beta hydrolase domain
MRRRFLVPLLALSTFVVLAAPSPARGAVECMPSVTGPIPITADSQPYRGRLVGQAPRGYVEQEFFVSCTALGEHYRTLIHVRRPVRPSRFSGDVVTEPVHPSDLWPIMSTTTSYWPAAGHASVVVVSSPFVLNNVAKPSNPERYADLEIPAAPGVERAILAQVGALLQSNFSTGPLPGLRVRRVVLGGYSNTGAVVRDFILNAHDQQRLGDGRPVYDGYFPVQTAVGSAPTPIPDVDVPVLEVMGEREVIRSFQRGFDELGYRRPDSGSYRLYEVAGQPHLTSRPPALAVPYICVEPVRSMFPQRHVWSMALANLLNWVDSGTEPPTAERIQLAPDGRTIVRDEHGNAIGGVRSTYLDVPIATYGAVSTNAPETPPGSRCDFLGFQVDFTHEKLVGLYGTHGRYVRAVSDRLRDLVRDNLYLSRDAQETLDEAVHADVP